MVSEEKNALAECEAEVDRSAERGKENNPWLPESEECDKQSPDERCTKDCEVEAPKRSSYKTLGQQLERTREELETEKKRSAELVDIVESLKKNYNEAVELIRRMHNRECELVAALGSLIRVLSVDFEKLEG